MTSQEALHVCFSLHKLSAIDDIDTQKDIATSMLESLNKACRTHIFELQIDISCNWFITARKKYVHTVGGKLVWPQH